MTARQRVLLFGLSVTEDKYGYSRRLQREFATDPTAPHIEIFGVGGLSHEPLPVLLDKAIQDRGGHFDYIILEIATSAYAKDRPVTAGMVDAVYDLIHRAQSTGAKVALVNWYRADFDYPYHVFDMALEAIAARYGLWLLDMAHGWLQDRGEGFFEPYLRDVTHTSVPEGGELMAREVGRFVRNIVASPRGQRLVPAPRVMRRALSFAALGRGGGMGRLERSDTVWPTTDIAEGESVTVELPDPILVVGFSYVNGPQAGLIDFKAEAGLPWGKGALWRFECVDQHAYYHRYHYRSLPEPVVADRVTVRQLPGIPDGVPLLKGEYAAGPRVGRLIHLHYHEPNGGGTA